MTVAATEAEVATASPETGSLVDQFRAIEAELDASEAPEAPAPKTPKEPKAVAAKEEPAEPEAEATAEEPSVAVKERAKFREDKRKLKEYESKLAAKEQQLALKEQQLAATSPANLKALIDAGKFDEAAGIYGFKSWNEMNDHAIRTFASPEYKRVKEIEQRLAAKEEQDRQAAEQIARQNQSAAQQRAQQEFIGALSDEFKESEDPEIKGLSEDPDFVASVFGRMVRHFQENDGEEMDPIEAAKEVLEVARKRHELFSKVFGGQPTSTAESPSRAGKSRETKAHKHVSRSAATTASAPASFKDDAEFFKIGAQMMREAGEEEYREKQKSKRAS